MAEEEKNNEEKQETVIIEVKGSELFENELICETGKNYKIIVKPEFFTFSL